MVFTEFRIPLPLTVDEFQVAQLFMVIEASKENTGDGEGVEWIKNEPFDNTDGHQDMAEISNVKVPRTKGQYTLKNYHIASKIPGIVAAMLPADAMILVEEAWNSYPYCKTVLTNGYLDKEKFRITIETMHVGDKGDSTNALNLTPDQLKSRTVETLDIIDEIDEAAEDYKAEYDPRLFKSEKTGRGELRSSWEQKHEPVMTCYKLVTADFKYWGMQGKVEGIIENAQRKLFRQTLRQAFCLIDKWHHLNMDDIRRLEAESKNELNKTLAETGATVEDEAKEGEASGSGAGAGSA